VDETGNNYTARDIKAAKGQLSQRKYHTVSAFIVVKIPGQCWINFYKWSYARSTTRHNYDAYSWTFIAPRKLRP